MDPNYMLKMAVSMVIFAPGLILLSAAVFVGLLMALEKLGVFDALIDRQRTMVGRASEQVAPSTSLQAGQTVDALKASVAAHGQSAEQEGSKRREQTG